MPFTHVYGKHACEGSVRTRMGYVAAKCRFPWGGIRRDHRGGMPENPHQIVLTYRVENCRARALPNNLNDEVRGGGRADCGAAIPQSLGKVLSRQRAVKI